MEFEEVKVNFEDFFSSVVENKNDEVYQISDALIMSLNNFAKVDMHYICDITKKEVSEVINSLKGIIFQNPRKRENDIYKGWEMKEEYLSGNLLIKLKEAQEAEKIYPGRFIENIDAIEEILPIKISRDEIYFTLGSPWIPPKIIEQFIYEIFDKKLIVSHDDLTGSWDLSDTFGYGVLESSVYGTYFMNAYRIIKKTLNFKSLEVKGKDVWTSTYFVDKEKTELLLNKQKAILDKFDSWVKSKKDVFNELQNIYYEKYGANKKRRYDGSFLELKDLKPGAVLYNYQKDAVARIIFSGTTLLAHDVGSGKTYEMIVAGHELKRLGLAKKVMFVFPKGVMVQWRNVFNELYDNLNVLVINNYNFSPSRRKETLNRIKNEDFDAILIPYSYFDKLKMSPDFHINKLNKERFEAKQRLNDEKNNTSTLRRKVNNIDKTYDKLIDHYNNEKLNNPDAIYFDDLNIDALFVDEAHNYKNVSVQSKITDILGVRNGESNKCDLMMEKAHYILKQNRGRGVVFATGTPVMNSISDVYIMQKYLQEGELEVLGLLNFDAWLKMFCELETNFEVDVVGNNFRLVNRFSKFHNLPELASILANVADFYHAENKTSVPIFKGYDDRIIKKDADFAKFLDEISKRVDDIKLGKPKVLGVNKNNKNINDNMLIVTNEGRKAALDLRLIDSSKYFFTTNSKVEVCATNVAYLYDHYKEEKLTQIIFCDTSVPSAKFNVYDELLRLLVQKGVNQDEIKFIHYAKSDIERKKLFSKVNKGEVRVLLGSTFKLGTGVNVQNKLIAIHHIDVPWRPGDMIQREGRIIRPGNTNKQIYIYRYIKENSFDAYSWQLLETKQKFIHNLLMNNLKVRTANDVDNTTLSYAEAKALAIGNPLIKNRIEVFNDLNRYLILQKSIKEQREKLIADIDSYRRNSYVLTDLINQATDDYNYYNSLSEEEKTKSQQERKDIREKIFVGANESVMKQKEELLINYLGFDVYGPSYYSPKGLYITLKRTGKYVIEIGESVSGVLVRIDNFLNNLEQYIKDIEDRKDNERRFIIEGEIELQKEVSYKNEIDKLTKELKRLDEKLGVKL